MELRLLCQANIRSLIMSFFPFDLKTQNRTSATRDPSKTLTLARWCSMSRMTVWNVSAWGNW